MTLPDPTTDPVPTEGGASSFGFLGSLIGLDRFERRIHERLDKIEQLFADNQALEATLASLLDTDRTLDAIEPTPPEGDQG